MLFENHINSRQFLERYILPKLNNHGPVLDVGVRHYTEHYKKILKVPCVTVDRQSIRKADITADVSLPTFPKIAGIEKFGSVLFNGVIHFGIDTLPHVNDTLNNFFHVLKPNGILLIGWNEWDINRKDIRTIATRNGFVSCLLFRQLVYEPYDPLENHYYSMWRKT